MKFDFSQFLSPFLSIFQQHNSYDTMMSSLEARKNMMDKYYNKQMDEAQTAFNRSYYRDYLDNSNARNMLKRVQQQLNERSKAARNKAAVMGGTTESLAAMQKDNNRTLDSVIGTLASADVAAKERAENAFAARQQALGDYQMGYTLDTFDKKRALEQEMGWGGGVKSIKQILDLLTKSYINRGLEGGNV